MDTLLLDVLKWDLTVDLNGNIAVASNPYALAQDAASAIRTFQGEVYYDTALGIPYFRDVLGEAVPVQLFKAYMVAAAMTVPEVTSAICFVQSIKNRVLTGQVQIMSNSGGVAVANF